MSSTKLSVKIYFKRELRFGMSNSAKKEYQCSRILTYWNSPVFSKYVQQTYFETYTQIFPDGKSHNAMEIQIVDELINNYDMIWSHWHERLFPQLKNLWKELLAEEQAKMAIFPWKYWMK